MTVPWVMNCQHQDSGWCLGCVAKLWEVKRLSLEVCQEFCKWFDDNPTIEMPWRAGLALRELMDKAHVAIAREEDKL